MKGKHGVSWMLGGWEGIGGVVGVFRRVTNYILIMSKTLNASQIKPITSERFF